MSELTVELIRDPELGGFYSWKLWVTDNRGNVASKTADFSTY